MGAKKAVVSFQDQEGLRHSVEVEADSLYEAAASAAVRFREHGFPPGLVTELSVEVTGPSITHVVTLRRVSDWSGATARSPRERLQKDRVKGMLSGVLR